MKYKNISSMYPMNKMLHVAFMVLMLSYTSCEQVSDLDSMELLQERIKPGYGKHADISNQDIRGQNLPTHDIFEDIEGKADTSHENVELNCPTFATIQKVMKEMKFKYEGKTGPSFVKVNPRGPISPPVWFLIHKLGMDYNARMLLPKVSCSYKNNSNEYERCYELDKGDDMFHEMLIYLLPSEEETVSAMSSQDTSFFRVITKNGEEMAIKFLAVLAASSLGLKIKYSYDRNPLLNDDERTLEIPHLGIRFVDKESALKKVVSLLDYLSDQEISSPKSKRKGVGNQSMLEKFLGSKGFLVQLPLLLFLNNEEKINTFFELFFYIVNRNTKIFERCFIPFDKKDGVNYNRIENILRKIEIFPFSELSPLPRKVTVPAFSRDKDEFLSKEFKYVDEVESFIVETACCLLYDSDKMEYLTDHLPESSFKNFFINHRSLFSFDVQCRKEIARLLGDIENPNLIYNVKSRYDENHREARNGLHIGFLNLFLALRETFHLDGEEYKSDLLDLKRTNDNIPTGKQREKEVIDEFKRISSKIIGALKDNDIEIEYDRFLSIDEITKHKSWDVFGRVFIYINTGNDWVKLELDHSMQVGQGKLYIEIDSDTIPESNNVETTKEPKKSFGNILDLLISKYADSLKPITRKRMEELVNEDIYNIFPCRALNSDPHKVAVLHALCSRLESEKKEIEKKESEKKKESKVTYTKIQKIISNLVANSVMVSEEAFRDYSSFFFASKKVLERYSGLLESDGDKALALSYAIEDEVGKETTYEYIRDNCDEIFSRKSRKYETYPDSFVLVCAIVSKDRRDLIDLLSEKMTAFFVIKRVLGLSEMVMARFAKSQGGGASSKLLKSLSWMLA